MYRHVGRIDGVIVSLGWWAGMVTMVTCPPASTIDDHRTAFVYRKASWIVYRGLLGHSKEWNTEPTPCFSIFSSDNRVYYFKLYLPVQIHVDGLGVHFLFHAVFGHRDTMELYLQCVFFI